MACSVSEDLTAYFDGELAAPERARVEVHLATCAECRGELELVRGLSARMQAMPMIEPSAQLRRDVLNALPEPKPGLFAWLRNLAPLGGLAAAAGVMLSLSHVNTDRASSGGDIVLAENLEVVENLPALETADLSDEDLEVVAQLDQLEVKE
ncbi:MAG: zf-HC2 domain-containing protein [Deltaproteobacteria bacterium]|nr:zf-HC2 domain-containing protein [Deltaproteobacteria bacterium]